MRKYLSNSPENESILIQQGFKLPSDAHKLGNDRFKKFNYIFTDDEWIRATNNMDSPWKVVE